MRRCSEEVWYWVMRGLTWWQTQSLPIFSEFQGRSFSGSQETAEREKFGICYQLQLLDAEIFLSLYYLEGLKSRNQCVHANFSESLNDGIVPRISDAFEWRLGMSLKLQTGLTELGCGAGCVQPKGDILYAVEKGDTLYKISDRHGCSLELLMEVSTEYQYFLPCLLVVLNLLNICK